MSIRSDGTEGFESGGKVNNRNVVDEVKEEWRLLWHNRIDDKSRAEGIASQDYLLLFIDRGTVIIATRDFKLLSLKQILGLHGILKIEQVETPHPSVGGWGKFARNVLSRQRRIRKWKEPVLRRRDNGKNLPLKKGGRGWLHYRTSTHK